MPTSPVTLPEIQLTQGKPVHTVSGHFQLPNGPFMVWQMDFMQLPMFHGYKYVYSLSVHSHWTEACLAVRSLHLV